MVEGDLRRARVVDQRVDAAPLLPARRPPCGGSPHPRRRSRAPAAFRPRAPRRLARGLSRLGFALGVVDDRATAALRELEWRTAAPMPVADPVTMQTPFFSSIRLRRHRRLDAAYGSWTTATRRVNSYAARARAFSVDATSSSRSAGRSLWTSCRKPDRSRSFLSGDPSAVEQHLRALRPARSRSASPCTTSHGSRQLRRAVCGTARRLPRTPRSAAGSLSAESVDRSRMRAARLRRSRSCARPARAECGCAARRREARRKNGFERIQSASEDFERIAGRDRASPAVPRASTAPHRDDRAHAVTPDEQRQLGRAPRQGLRPEIQVVDEIVEARRRASRAGSRAVAALIVSETGNAAAGERRCNGRVAIGVLGEAVHDEQGCARLLRDGRKSRERDIGQG